MRKSIVERYNGIFDPETLARAQCNSEGLPPEEWTRRISAQNERITERSCNIWDRVPRHTSDGSRTGVVHRYFQKKIWIRIRDTYERMRLISRRFGACAPRS